MANNKLVTVDVLQYNNEKIKEQLNKKIDIQQDVADANKVLGIDADGKVVPVEAPDSVKVSAENDNAIEVRNDGIYVAPTDLSGLVEKVDGKGLSTNDLTDEMVEKIGNTYTKEETYSRTEVDDAITNAQLGGEEVDLSEYIKEADADEKYVLDEEIKVYTEDDITALLGLSEEELEGIAQLISDAEVRIDKTYSSSKIYSELNRILEEGKTYTLTEIAKKSGASYKIAATTDDMISTEYIYLIANGDTYDMYICEEENSVPVKIGTTEIDLSGFYSKTESENLFATKVDVIANYATKSELQSAIEDVEIEVSIDEDNQIESRQNGLYVGKQFVECTQAEYDAMSEEDRKDIPFFITDAESSNSGNGSVSTDAETLGGYSADDFAKTTDLANYLPLTGGTVTGDIIQASDGDTKIVHRLKNSLREIAFAVQNNGKFQIYDTTNNNDIFTSDVDGTNTLKGTASNANTLDGHDSEYFASAQSVKDNSLWYELTNGFDLNEALGRYRTSSTERIGTLLNKPSSVVGGEITVEWFPSKSNNNYGVQIIKQTKGSGCKIYFRQKQEDTWDEWTTIATTSDLENYLSLTGGTVTSSNLGIISVKRETGDSSAVKYENANGVLGYIGFDVNKKLTYFETDVTKRHDILHSGNLVTTVDENSTDTSVPSAKAVYNEITVINDSLDDLNTIIGTSKTIGLSESIVVENKTHTDLMSITLPAGKWIVIGNARFSANAVGGRCLAMHATSQWAGTENTRKSIGTIADALENVKYWNLSQETTLYLIGYQDSGEALTVDTGKMTAIRVG